METASGHDGSRTRVPAGGGAGNGAGKITLPEKGEPVRMLTMNAGNYFVPEDRGEAIFK